MSFAALAHGRVDVGLAELAGALRDPDAFLIATKLSQVELDECGPACDAICHCEEDPA